jgi:tetratricopeptide (TPR) repeat protein
MLSQAHSRLSEWEQAECIARECVQLAEGLGEARLLADAVARLGITTVETRPREAVELHRRALQIFTEVGDRHGQVRCFINQGVAWTRVGDVAEAERSFVRALEAGRAAHAPDLAGLASLNAGVLAVRLGHYEEAQARYTEALRLFRAVRNEPHRLGTLYNLGSLAHERGDAAAALTLYSDAAALARDIGQPDLQAGALAGIGLAALSLGRADVAAEAARDVAPLVADRQAWWFQGRELVEAFRVRAALAAGDAELGESRFDAALAMAEAHDRYGAVWLVAECAPSLAAAGRERVWEAVTRFAPVAHDIGNVALAARFAALAAHQALPPAAA